ncbi:hypothetical protein B7R54_10615 [Subtercola boreus]|uniref:Uncharacterized protein n=1 Tax=Subtercola boreus TaxID=120213 RepID=A0A3E0VIT3_9MICO|nr:hypothetical protein B7R54_10615 [Subtercola boreus]
MGAVIVAGLLVLGIGAAGGALALGFGPQVFPVATPTPTATTTPTPTVTAMPTATASVPPVAPEPAVPTVSVATTTTFTAPSWGDGLTADVSGLTPNTDYSVSTDARYRGESKTPDGYFSAFSSPIAFTTDAEGGATVSWIPDAFPENFTDSLESGFVLGTYVRVDPAGGPESDSSTAGFAEAIALSEPLPIVYLPENLVTVTAPACITSVDLVGEAVGLPVELTGLVSGEYVVVKSRQTDGVQSYGFAGYGRADESGTAHIVMHGNTAFYPVSTSADIAPGRWEIVVLGNYRAVSPDEADRPSTELQVGDCA